MNRPRRPHRLILGGVLAVAALLVALGPAQPASAWGERQATRSCGANWIESWATPTGGQSNTHRLGGNCPGRLTSGLRTSGGLVYYARGTNVNASFKRDGRWVGGAHQGCDACAYSFT